VGLRTHRELRKAEEGQVGREGGGVGAWDARGEQADEGRGEGKGMARGGLRPNLNSSACTCGSFAPAAHIRAC
jgi:hypothetical protein